MSLIYPALPQPQYKTTQQIRSHNEKTHATLANWWEVVCLSRLFHLKLMLTVQSLFNVRKHALLKPFLSKSYKWCLLLVHPECKFCHMSFCGPQKDEKDAKNNKNIIKVVHTTCALYFMSSEAIRLCSVKMYVKIHW